jgi:hypothetical protein
LLLRVIGLRVSAQRGNAGLIRRAGSPQDIHVARGQEPRGPGLDAVSFLRRVGSVLNRHARLHAAALLDTRRQRPHRPRPLRDTRTLDHHLGGQLGRARPLTKVHAAGDLRPSCRSPEAPARVSRSVCAESPAAAGRHGVRGQQRWQAARCRDDAPFPSGRGPG